MDFMKVFDQTVREIQREVNLRVLKVPEIEQKVLDATSSEPWGPHGSALAEIAQATKKFADCQMVMNVLWTRLTDTGRNWRHVYKALAVIEYLVANGSERAIDDILEHTFQISSLSGFEYVEPNGKDMGINVRKKAETILALVNNKDKIEEVRNKAAANREKYVGLSSSGITYKSTSAAYGSSSYHQSGHNGGFGSSREDVHTDREHLGDEIDWSRAEKPRSRRGYANESGENGSKKEPSSAASRSKGSTYMSQSNKTYGSVSASQSSTAPPTNDEDDFDDFDPRGTSTSGSAAAGTNQVDLFGESLIDFMDAPTPVPTETTSSKTNTSPDDDLFEDASFVSASPHAEVKVDTAAQPSVDLFAQQSSPPAAFPTLVDPFAQKSPPAAFPAPVDPFAAFAPPMPVEAPSSKMQAARSESFDPFAAVPLNKFDGSDIFGDFTSSNAPGQSSVEDAKCLDQKTSAETKLQPKKDTFQVKSGIWADSLSRGLIDLNISAPKKVSLADVGVVGGLTDGSDENEKVPTASAYMGRAMGMGYGVGRAGFTPTTGSSNASFSNFGQHQFGNFK